MKEPISSEDIRKGDLIREEYDNGTNERPLLTAMEYVADMDRNTQSRAYAARWFLLDREAVDLPEFPTLGYLTASQAGGSNPVPQRDLAMWSRPFWDQGTSIQRNGKPCGIVPRWVTEFEPVAVVPPEALEKLRAVHHESAGGPGYCTHVVDFLHAVDKAAKA